MLSRLVNIIVILGLLLSGIPLPLANAAPSVEVIPSTEADVAATVNSTASGFDPDRVTIQAGETVAWVNTTAQVQSINGGPTYRIFLPLVIRNQGSQQMSITAGSVVPGSATTNWRSGDI